MAEGYTHQQETALFTSAFFDELVYWGVRETVICPGSRSTALAMTAHEMSLREPDRMRIYVDVDERGAAFFALGLAKASGRPVALVCTSGTAVANFYPAVVEAATSRVPLIVLTGDRPVRLQGLGAPQTCDQVKAYGDYVRAFRQMPEPGADLREILFARQAAREAVLAAMGPGSRGLRDGLWEERDTWALAGEGLEAAGEPEAAAGELEMAVGESEAAGWQPVASRGCAYMAGPVHLNFPFDEPLKPDFAVDDVFEVGRSEALPGTPAFSGYTVFGADATISLGMMMFGRRVLVLAGEGTCETVAEARAVIEWANECKLPLLADPLSGLRGFDEPCVIDNYDNILRDGRGLMPELVIRFGRYPVSKVASLGLVVDAAQSIVVDVAETRDFNCMTDVFVSCTPIDFVMQDWVFSVDGVQERFFAKWTERNDEERERILAVEQAEGEPCEGAFVRKLLELIPAGSCLFSANSMSVRAIDTFMVKEDKPIAVLCNRGQNGIDGTVSTALGVSQRFAQTTFLTGDFTMLHDLNALALQRELRLHHGPSAGEPERSMVIVLLNNNGGAIFDMLPQASDDEYFERLFLVPQDVDFEKAVSAFGVPYERARTVEEFSAAYQGFLGKPGISFIEVEVPLRGVCGRYAKYQQRA